MIGIVTCIKYMQKYKSYLLSCVCSFLLSCNMGVVVSAKKKKKGRSSFPKLGSNLLCPFIKFRDLFQKHALSKCWNC